MSASSEIAVLHAMENRHELFASLKEIFRSDKYLDVFMALEDNMTQREIADKSGVGQSTISRAVKDLKEYDLIEETDNGYRKTLPVFGHPILQYFYRQEVQENGQ